MCQTESQVEEEIRTAIHFVRNVNDLNIGYNSGVNNCVRYALIHNF